MARKNRLGTPYLGLYPVKDPMTKRIKARLKEKNVTAKYWLRYLIRKELGDVNTKGIQL